MRNLSDYTPKSSKTHRMIDLTENVPSEDEEEEDDEEDEEKRTMFCGNLHQKITEALLYEICLQVSDSSSNTTVLINSNFRQVHWKKFTFPSQKMVPRKISDSPHINTRARCSTQWTSWKE